MSPKTRSLNDGRRAPWARPRDVMAFAVTFALAASADFALAQPEVRLELSAPFVYEGQPLMASVKVLNPDSRISPPSLPAVDGLRVEGPGSPSQQTSMVNGRTTQAISFPFRITPLAGRVGKFTLGPATVPRQGRGPLASSPVELQVARVPSSQVRFRVEADPPGGPVGAPFQLIYRVDHAGGQEPEESDFFNMGRSQEGLTGLELPALSLDSLELKPLRLLPDQEARQAQLRGGEPIILQESFTIDPDGTGWTTIIVAFEATPLITGSIPIGDATAVLRLKTGETQRRRGFFGTEEVAVVREFQAKTGPASYLVKDLPTAGRPAGFSGAVGTFSVSVKADVTKVQVLDPITLELRVTGRGSLKTLRPPLLAEVPSITKDFEVLGDVDSGEIEENAKVFHLVLRPRTDQVQAIPPIPYPYYDPRSERYGVAQSEAIPITVAAVRVVTGEDAIRTAPPGPGSSSTARAVERAVPALQRQEGIMANFDAVGESQATLDPRGALLEAPFVAALLTPPVAYAALLLLLRRRKRSPEAVRRARALSRALSSLSAPGIEADALTSAVETYLCDRLGLEPGEVTPPEAERALAARGVSAEVARRLRSSLEALHASRYGGSGGSGSTEPQARELRTSIEEVDRCLGAL